MSFEEPTDLEILQQRVSSVEILLNLVCAQLTSEQKENVNAALDKHLDIWKGKDLMEDIFNGAKRQLNKNL
jgi:hypothetical protein